MFLIQKKKGLAFIEKIKKYNIVILDDGLQNYTIVKDIKLLLIDRHILFGNKLCIPAGPLRQSIKTCLERVDCIIFTGNPSKQVNLKINKRTFNSEIRINNNKIKKNQKFLAFSGLAVNQKFFDTLKLNDYNVKEKIEFSDHFSYSENLIQKLIKIAKTKQLRLITTEKDKVKIDKKFHKYIDELLIEAKIKKDDEKKFRIFLESRLSD